MRAGEHDDRRPIVVLVDDDRAVLNALKFSLELDGFQVATYARGSELLARSSFPTAGCLIIDFRLPDMDGLSLLAALRRRAVTLPAILITSRPNAALRRRAAADHVSIVEKPLLGDALSNSIQSLLAGAHEKAHQVGRST
jgi:FixJ family two-component response regulator